MNRRRVLGVVLVLIGGLLVTNPLYMYQHPDEINEVLIVSEPRKEPVANYSYSELSPRAKTLFDRARRESDNSTTFHGTESAPKELDFVAEEENVGWAGHFYRVSYQSETYYVWAFQQPSVGQEKRRSQALLGLGAALLLAGALYLWRGTQPMTTGVGLGATGGLMFLLNLFYRFARDLLGPLNVLGGSIFVLAAMLLSIGGAGYLSYLTARDRFLDRHPTTGDGPR